MTTSRISQRLGKDFKTLLVSATTMMSMGAFAAPFNPKPITIDNNGDAVTIQRLGDEHFSFTQTTDGYMVGKDSAGVYYYLSDDGLISGVKAKNADKRSAADILFLNSLDEKQVSSYYRSHNAMKHMAPAEYRHEKRASWVPTGDNDTVAAGDGTHPVMRMPSGEHQNGNLRFPVILVSGSGSTNADSAAFSNRLNQEGYNLDKHTGSVKDYFKSQSNGKFVPTYDVYLVSVSNSLSSYAGSESKLIKEAITKLRSKYTNFNASQYDADNDGKIDAVGVIYAGTESAANNLGGFQYELQWNEEDMQDAGNGKKFNNYLIIAQMESDGVLLPIATFVHEFSHTMGLRDHYSVQNYPTTFTTQFPGTHAWDVMSTGMYNNGGATPPGYSAFEKEFMGWITTKTLTTSSATTAITALNTTNVAYKVPVSGDDDEFFLLENRQLTGWDAYLPNHGMLIWHIDYDQEAWDGDVMNDTEDHQRIDVVEAGNLAVTSYFDGFESTHLIDDPFPGSQNVTTFTKFNSWAGVNQGVNLYNITEKDGVIYFTTEQNVSVDTNTQADTTGTGSGSSTQNPSISGDTDVEILKQDTTVYEFTFNVTLPISSEYEGVGIDLSAVYDSLGVTTSQVSSMTVYGVEPDGTLNSNNTANNGQWFDANGNVSSYSNGYVFSEIRTPSCIDTVGHYPDKVSAGQTYTIRQALINGLKKAVYTINITIATSTSVNETANEAVIAVKDQTLSISGLTDGNKTAQIFNAKGQMIYSQNFTENTKDINLSDVKNSQIMIIKVIDSNHNEIAKKFLIKK